MKRDNKILSVLLPWESLSLSLLFMARDRGVALASLSLFGHEYYRIHELNCSAVRGAFKGQPTLAINLEE